MYTYSPAPWYKLLANASRPLVVELDPRTDSKCEPAGQLLAAVVQDAVESEMCTHESAPSEPSSA